MAAAAALVRARILISILIDASWGALIIAESIGEMGQGFYQLSLAPPPEVDPPESGGSQEPLWAYPPPPDVLALE